MMSVHITYSQNYELKELSYYQKIVPEYQAWMDNSGLGGILKADLVEIKDKELHFLIKPRFEKGDSAKIAWITLKQKYNNQNQHTLEEVLYYNALNAFKVKPERLIVEILDDYEEACLWLELSFDIEKRKIIKRETICRTKNADFTIDIADVKNKAIKIDVKNDIKNRKQIYAAILKYAKEKYAAKHKGTDVTFRYEPGNNESLTFMAIGLRQEVLKAEDNIWIADLLNWTFNTADYDWRKIEVLKFTITYKKANDKQIYIDCEIDGRYGSGYYKTTDWNKCIPMDPEFDWYLQSYTDRFRTEIYELLSN